MEKVRIVKKFEFSRNILFYKTTPWQLNASMFNGKNTRPYKSKWTAEYMQEPVD